jgi:hypothetical protein
MSIKYNIIYIYVIFQNGSNIQNVAFHFFQKTYSLEPELHLSMSLYEGISTMEYYNKRLVHACGFHMEFYRTIWTAD